MMGSAAVTCRRAVPGPVPRPVTPAPTINSLEGTCRRKRAGRRCASLDLDALPRDVGPVAMTMFGLDRLGLAVVAGDLDCRCSIFPPLLTSILFFFIERSTP
jgi:hypothetical protein